MPADDGEAIERTITKCVTLESVQNRRNMDHGRFIHYSNVRMTILSIGLPIAAVIAAEAIKNRFNSELFALAALLAALSYLMFCFFSVQALYSLIEYSCLEKWLERNAEDEPFAEPRVRTHGALEPYFRSLLGKRPLFATVAGEEVLPHFGKMERVIQIAVVVITIGFFIFAYLIAPK